MRLGEAKTPPRMRIYAIGDVHGLDTLLAEAHAEIEADLAARPVADHRIIHVGDYVDRGPNSAAVIERLSRLQETDPRILCLMGNHDELMLAFLADPGAAGPDWMMNGAGATFRSYGIDTSGVSSAGDHRRLCKALAAALPASHRLFLDHLRLSIRFGDFLFCHAGIRPGVPLDLQSDHDLLWIRDEFLFSNRDHGVVVVHGHTPAQAPEVRPNRINVDTGAVYGGPLTVLALEGTSHRFL
ncbi:MAG TPA: metallophosphoesterase family protein [Bauldia sp.]|nr:metallophosphoesterase family protein [Bauldia sp.]